MMIPPAALYRRFSRRVAWAAPFLTGAVAFAAPPAPTEPAAPNDYVLFVGTDLAIKQGGRFYPVVGATVDTFQIERDHSEQTIRNIRDAKIQISRGVKLSNRSAAITDMKIENIDRAAAQSRFEAMKSAMQLNDEAADGMDRLQGAITSANAVGTFYDPNSANNPRGAKETAEAVQANQASAVTNFNSGMPGLQSLADAANTQFNAKLADGRPTEVELSFEVSSPEPLEHAYVVVVANYGSGSGGASKVTAQQLDRVDGRPRRVQLTHAMSIAGLEFQNFDIGLFADGQEIATNLSAKRVPLTADEAYKVHLVHYLAENATATKAPVPMLMGPRAVFRRQMGSAETNRPIYATVGKSGATVKLTADEAGMEKIPAAIETAMQNVRFMPALRNGTPVDGRLMLTLGELVN